MTDTLDEAALRHVLEEARRAHEASAKRSKPSSQPPQASAP